TRKHDGSADVGMPGKGDLGSRSKNAHVSAVIGIPRRQHERGLGVVELGGNRLHLCGVEALRIQNDRQWVAAEDSLAEDIHRRVASLHLNHPTPTVGWPGA